MVITFMNVMSFITMISIELFRTLQHGDTSPTCARPIHFSLPQCLGTVHEH
jgi:hypothetical protein